MKILPYGDIIMLFMMKTMLKKLHICLLAVVMLVIAAIGFASCKSNQEKNLLIDPSENGCIVSRLNPNYKGKVVIPDYYNETPVVSIGVYAFFGCDKMKSVKIPDTIADIGEFAFYDCFKLKKLTIPDSVTNLGEGAFYGCTRATKIILPSGITNIPKGLCYNCLSLKKITIPDSVTKIGVDAFRLCGSLKKIALPQAVTDIGEGAFKWCDALTEVTLSSNVTSIGANAFEWCKSLTSIKFSGTKEKWNAIKKGNAWNGYTGNFLVKCKDGTLDKEGNEIA